MFGVAYTYRLSPMSAPTKSVEVANASQLNGTVVQQYTTWDGDPQKFNILASGSNWKIAMKANNMKCIGPAGAGTANGTMIEVQDCNGSYAQAWTVTPDVQTGAFFFKNVASGRCLDVPSGVTADGARLDLFNCSTATNQKFKVQAF
jgi:hypothetical protein